MVMLKEQLVACANQIAAYQVEYNVVVAQMSNVAERASDIANRRFAAIARFEMETGDSVKKNPDLDKWATRLNTKRPKLPTMLAGKMGKKDAAAKKRQPTFRSLMPLDLERERNDVLASFGLSPDEPAEILNAGERSDAKSNE